LRDALLPGLKPHWNKEFVRYDHTDDGRPRAHFADGTTAVTDVLVGADGSNSRVRRQRLPSLERIDTGVLNIAGRYPLTADNAARLPDTLIDSSVNNVVPRGPGWMFVSTWREPDGAGHVVWAYAANRACYPSHVLDLDAAGLRDVVLDRIADWAPALRTLVTDADDISPVPLRCMPPLPTWQPTTVTLIGDAIHNMTPMAGIGANTALRDAAELTNALAAHPAPMTAIATYENTMRTYANNALRISLRNAHNAASPARLPRHAFRTMLRLADNIPPLKRAMFTTR
jgi:2-polyprenyl-6-methoxyphenol hydroxylase-like FAD-dependent oxidoreductase